MPTLQLIADIHFKPPCHSSSKPELKFGLSKAKMCFSPFKCTNSSPHYRREICAILHAVNDAGSIKSRLLTIDLLRQQHLKIGIDSVLI